MRAQAPFRILSLLAISAMLSACGGGGGGSTGGGSTPITQTPNPIGATATPIPQPTASASCASIAERGNDGMVYRGLSGRGPSLVPNALYVTYASANAAAGASRGIAGVVRTNAVGAHKGVTANVVALANGADAESVAAKLRTQAGVTSVNRLHYRYLADANDPELNTKYQWYLYKTNGDPGAWALTHGSPAVKIAVLDTGIDETNVDLTANLAYQEGVHTDQTTGVQTVSTANANVQDSNGHGSSTAGLADAATNNGYGFASIGYASGLMAFNIFPATTNAAPCPGADVRDIATAIDDAVANGASVISMSLGDSESDTLEQTAVENAISAGVTVVAAAGNDYGKADGNSPEYPAAYAGVISVGASAVTDSEANTYSAITSETIASYSNSGPTLVAPGGDVNGNDTDTDDLHWIAAYYTTTPGNTANGTCQPTDVICAALWNGTSQATPQVAGTVALMEAVHGGAKSLTPAAAKTLLVNNVDVLPGITATRQGAGRLDSQKAVMAAQ